MAKVAFSFPILSIQGAAHPGTFKTKMPQASITLEPSRSRVPKIRTLSEDDYTRRIFAKADLLYQSFSAQQRASWRAGIKRRDLTSYTLWMKEALYLGNLGLYLPDRPGPSGGYSPASAIEGVINPSPKTIPHPQWRIRNVGDDCEWRAPGTTCKVYDVCTFLPNPMDFAMYDRQWQRVYQVPDFPCYFTSVLPSPLRDWQLDLQLSPYAEADPDWGPDGIPAGWSISFTLWGRTPPNAPYINFYWTVPNDLGTMSADLLCFNSFPGGFGYRGVTIAKVKPADRRPRPPRKHKPCVPRSDPWPD